jgi:uncharacterized protein (TIGR00369 family)
LQAGVQGAAHERDAAIDRGLQNISIEEYWGGRGPKKSWRSAQNPLISVLETFLRRRPIAQSRPGLITLMAQSAFEFVRDNMAGTPFHQWLLPELLEVDEQAGSVTVRLPIRPEFGRLPGRPELHGAIVAAMVDISGHAAIAAKLLHSVATIDMRVDYLRLAGGSELIAMATVIKIGRTIGVVDVRINDDQKRLVAIGRAAYVTMSV